MRPQHCVIAAERSFPCEKRNQFDKSILDAYIKIIPLQQISFVTYDLHVAIKHAKSLQLFVLSFMGA